MPTQTAIITGAGSGVGRAVAVDLAAKGWKLVLLGRRIANLDETRALTKVPPDQVAAIPCDIGDAGDVERAMHAAHDFLGHHVDALINSAGTNIPKRSFRDLSLPDYHEVINANLNGAYYTTRAVLPAMRKKQGGTIIHIGSDAGLFANPVSGPAYIAAKFGLTGLTAAINVEEKAHGIRACIIQPGPIDTPLMAKRPVMPDEAARAKMLQPEDISAAVAFVLELPSRAVVEEILIRPR